MKFQVHAKLDLRTDLKDFSSIESYLIGLAVFWLSIYFLIDFLLSNRNHFTSEIGNKL